MNFFSTDPQFLTGQYANNGSMQPTLHPCAFGLKQSCATYDQCKNTNS